MILNELANYWISSKLAHQNWNAQAFHIPKPCIHKLE
jgi:hypothetical protein